MILQQSLMIWENQTQDHFINQIENVNCIYNKTKEIYFDKENVYLEIK